LSFQKTVIDFSEPLKSIAMRNLSFNRITIISLVVFFAAVLYSCQKENSLSSSTQTISEEQASVYSDESTQADASFEDVGDVGMMAADEEGVESTSGRSEDGGRPYLPTFDELRLRLGPCATITITPNDSTYPKTIVIDFGDGCLCRDGKFRKGAIVLHLTGPIRRPGSVLTITFRNFYLNRAHIEGTKIFSNLSENGQVKFTVQVVGGKVTFPNGRGYSYQSLKYVVQIEGMGTNTIRDDVYRIEGRSKTEFNNGLTVILDTDDPLIKKVACHWISDGTLKIKLNDRVFKLDYGFPNNGDCDNQALLLWNNGNSQRVITLP
jgi:hypothetical protein